MVIFSFKFGSLRPALVTAQLRRRHVLTSGQRLCSLGYLMVTPSKHPLIPSGLETTGWKPLGLHKVMLFGAGLGYEGSS